MEENEYDRHPLYSTVKTFERYVQGHHKVSSVQKIKEYLYLIHRVDLSPITVVLTNCYVFSEADLYEIIEEFDGVGCVMNGGNWNNYSFYAKETAKEQDIGIFNFSEFFGALNYEGDEFLNYEKPDPDKKKNS